MNSLVQYYKSLLCNKVDQNSEAFVKRIDAIHSGDWERVEFLDKCILEPLDKQINYLANKTVQLLGGNQNG